MSLFKDSPLVKEIGASSFTNKKLKKNLLGPSGAMVIFYGGFCGHCQRMAPEIKKFANSMGSNLKVYVIESKHQELTNRFNIQGFPTVKFARSDGVLIPADKFGRDIQSMLNYACSKASVCKLLK